MPPMQMYHPTKVLCWHGSYQYPPVTKSIGILRALMAVNVFFYSINEGEISYEIVTLTFAQLDSHLITRIWGRRDLFRLVT